MFNRFPDTRPDGPAPKDIRRCRSLAHAAFQVRQTTPYVSGRRRRQNFRRGDLRSFSTYR